MLKKILSISGKPGLYELISQGRNMLIVESLSEKRRMPAYAHEKIISLADIAIFTDSDEVPLRQVFAAIKEKEGGAKIAMNIKDPKNDVRAYFEQVLPNYDRNRFHVSDMKKVVTWYNLLIEAGKTDFSEEK